MHRHLRNHMLLLDRRRGPAWATLDYASLGGGTLSNGDLTFSLGGGWAMIYANASKLTGIHSFQMRFDSGSYAGLGFDVFDGAGVHQYPGEDAETGFGITSHGYNCSPSGLTSNGVTLATGDYALAVLNRDDSTAQFYKLVAGAWSLVWDADISAADGVALYPVGFFLNGSATFNFGQSAFQAATPNGEPAGVLR